MKQIAIIAPTASGKTSLSIKMAFETNSIILSLDSLSIYKDINIASAKPTKKEQKGILHFGINEIYPSQSFTVLDFIDIYSKAKKYAKINKKNLIIVGGSGFYLKTLMTGISNIPKMSKKTIAWVNNKLLKLDNAYNFMFHLDKNYMSKISINDKYRIEKSLLIYKQTGQIPTIYFQNNTPKPIIKDIKIYDINWSVDDLRKRIQMRTKNMLNNGLIDEAIFLEKKYTREPNCMNSIGVVEVFEYLDGKISRNILEQKININTTRLAKRQRTFNKSQFSNNIVEFIKI